MTDILNDKNDMQNSENQSSPENQHSAENQPNSNEPSSDQCNESDSSDVASNQHITACGYTFGEHASSGIPVHYLSVLLKYFLPLDYVYDQSLKQTIESQFAENLVDLKLELKPDMTSAHVTGSKAEGLAIPEHTLNNTAHVNSALDRTDIIAFKNIFKIEDTIEESLNMDVVTEEPPFKHATPSGGKILETASPGSPKNCTTVKFTQDAITAFKLQNVKHLESRLHQMFLNFDENLSRTSLQRLLLQLSSDTTIPSCKDSKEPNDVTECNKIPVVSLLEWPEIAEKWATRPRGSGWPQEQYIEQIRQNGVHILPVKDSSDYKNTWIYSFFHAETTLAQLLTKDHRKCFILLKLLYEHYFNEPDVLLPFHLKSFFFWICEFIPAVDFRDTNLGCILLTVLETLADVLRKRDLDHYFIDGINLLADIDPERGYTLSKKVRWVMENIIECILNIDNKISFSNVLRNREKLSVIFASVVHASSSSSMDVDGFYSSGSDSLVELLRAYMDISKYVQTSNSKVEQCTTLNVMTDLFREILVDLRGFQDVSETMNNMDFMLGALISVKKDANLLCELYLHLCLRATLSDKSKMISVLDGVFNRSDRIPMLQGKKFILAAMIKILNDMVVPKETEISNQALYMHHYKELLLDEMLGGMSLE